MDILLNIQGLFPFLFILGISPLLVGLINKQKALLTGRIGAPLWQPYFDLLRLTRKETIYAVTASFVSRLAPVVAFAACMSFAERDDAKSVTIVEFDKTQIIDIKEKALPNFRSLIRFKGSLKEVDDEICAFENKGMLTAFGELLLTEPFTQLVIDDLKENAKKKGVEILKYTFESQKIEKDDREEVLNNKTLEDLSVEDIFLMRCENAKYSEEQLVDVKKTFDELKEWMLSNEIK